MGTETRRGARVWGKVKLGPDSRVVRKLDAWPSIGLRHYIFYYGKFSVCFKNIASTHRR